MELGWQHSPLFVEDRSEVAHVLDDIIQERLRHYRKERVVARSSVGGKAEYTTNGIDEARERE